MKKEMVKGAIVQFKMNWDEIPTPGNTSIVTRVAKNKSWCDVVTPFGRKRVPNPLENLKIITKPLTVYLP